MRTRFDKEGLLLTIAVAATSDYHRSAYNVPEINKYVDFVNLMSYDLHASWDGQTGHNAPLYPASWEVSSSYLSQLNVDACVRGWLDSGLDPNKLIMGIPAYGHTFTLASTSSTGVGVRTIGGGNAGPYTFESGTLSYLEICERFKAGGYTKYWDDVQKVPYAVNGNQWISYDDVTSIELKIAYAKNKKLGGVMLWSLESDDDRNLCGGGLYTIGTTVYNAVFGSSPPPTSPTTVKPTTTTTTKPVTTTTTKPVTTTTAKPAATTSTQKPAVTTTTPATTTTPSGTLICPSSGFKRDPTNCGAFYQCYPGQPVNYAWRLLCQSGLYFDEASSTCNWSFLVSYKVFCFYLGSAKYRVGNGRVTIGDLNPTLCTHLVYQHYTLSLAGAVQDVDTNELKQLLALKASNPWMKVLVSVGGPTLSSKTMSGLVKNITQRRLVVKNLIALIVNNALDGLDIAWFYPVLLGGEPGDRDLFVQLLLELNVQLRPAGKLLTISTTST
ncbi:chitotriosidase-1 [Culex quinquefasciatus]|uniref:Chitotriosidase-1 n=1 Tax=Culex quinquefasciatus TaxID=7176 RepID=B0XJ10_CULQU|nr:chitotriosidase-1 [Culex quinquefasciatus]|eukprot:XP_001869632.1 chitotriosidase-1 [Culex quinquefasciatus]